MDNLDKLLLITEAIYATSSARKLFEKFAESFSDMERKNNCSQGQSRIFQFFTIFLAL